MQPVRSPPRREIGAQKTGSTDASDTLECELTFPLHIPFPFAVFWVKATAHVEGH